ncbi:hypothetical protein [Halalkalicoccus salilacus]
MVRISSLVIVFGIVAGIGLLPVPIPGIGIGLGLLIVLVGLVLRLVGV